MIKTIDNIRYKKQLILFNTNIKEINEQINDIFSLGLNFSMKGNDISFGIKFS